MFVHQNDQMTGYDICVLHCGHYMCVLITFCFVVWEYLYL